MKWFGTFLKSDSIYDLTLNKYFFFWRWIEALLLFSTSFYMTWLFFAMIYWIIAYYHGDFDKVAIAEFENKTCPNESCWKYCVLKIEDFASCFLFSLETQVKLKIKISWIPQRRTKSNHLLGITTSNSLIDDWDQKYGQRLFRLFSSQIICF